MVPYADIVGYLIYMPSVKLKETLLYRLEPRDIISMLCMRYFRIHVHKFQSWLLSQF